MPRTFLQLISGLATATGQSGFCRVEHFASEPLSSRVIATFKTPARCSPVSFSSRNSGEKILDACAAPGGKTSYLAQLMQNRGSIVACDRELRRLQIVNDNVARLGVDHCPMLSITIGSARIFRKTLRQSNHSIVCLWTHLARIRESCAAGST